MDIVTVRVVMEMDILHVRLGGRFTRVANPLLGYFSPSVADTCEQDVVWRRWLSAVGTLGVA